MFWQPWWLKRGKKRENYKNQARAIGSDGFRARCSVKNHFMRKSVGETAWTMEGRKSVLAFDQPQEFCDSFTTIAEKI